MWPLALLDPWVLRRPFEGRTAERYTAMRRAFGDLDERLAARMGPDLDGARCFLDVGAGGGETCARIAEARRELTVVGVEPSRALSSMFVRGVARSGGARRARVVRARAESLPFPDRSVDVALCLSSLRHVVDRHAALRELRRVVRPGGAAWIVEVDSGADRRRTQAHLDAIDDPAARISFSLWVMGACPPPDRFVRAARGAGWRHTQLRPDETQPFFLLRLT